MSALDIQFTRRTDLLAARLQSQLLPDLGYRDRLSSLDQTEENYRYCYPPTGYERSISAIARDMIDRRREKMTLDAVEDLIIHLDGLREERKAILLVSEGWLLYRENRALAEIARPQIPGIGTGPTGQIGTSDRNNPYGARQSECDRDRLMLANLDNDRRFRDLLDQANRANASFYTIDPAGLRVFDADVGPEPAPPLEVDSAMLRQRIDTLRVAAENTDGVAVVNSNDIDGGLKRVVADLTSYYLFGYSSTNTKLDGRFRSIKVRVKRPGVDVRARRGYRAPTEAEVAARASVAAAPIISEDEAALNRAVTSLEAVRANAPFRLQVSPGWWTPPGPALPGKAPGAEPALWIYGEIETKRPGGDDWSQGGQAEVSILSDKGDTVTTYRVPIAAGASTFVTRFPRSEEDVWLDPGSYAVRVRVKPSTGGLSTLDTARFDVPKTPAAGSFALGLPVYARRGQATGNVEVMTADLRYRRVERIAVEISATLAPDSVTGELLDRKGKPIALPVTASTVQKDAVVWVRGDMPLASLAPGDYVLRLTATKGTEKKQVLAPFRIVP
jgi:VWFA-related protein